jgi:hypothetical protein
MSRVEDEPRRKIKDKCIYGSYKQKLRLMIRFMVFNATFNNISVILWRSVLLVEETRVPRENHRPVASLTNFITRCCIEYTSTWTRFELTTLVVIDTDSISSCKSNYHTITVFIWLIEGIDCLLKFWSFAKVYIHSNLSMLTKHTLKINLLINLPIPFIHK